MHNLHNSVVQRNGDAPQGSSTEMGSLNRQPINTTQALTQESGADTNRVANQLVHDLNTALNGLPICTYSAI